MKRLPLFDFPDSIVSRRKVNNYFPDSTGGNDGERLGFGLNIYINVLCLF